jgi:hypothetical protein
MSDLHADLRIPRARLAGTRDLRRVAGARDLHAP